MTAPRITRLVLNGTREVHARIRGTEVFYVSPAAAKAATAAWLAANARTTAHVAEDSAGKWFEVEVTLPAAFDGNPADGWTGVIHPSHPPATLGLRWSQDLVAWTPFLDGWESAPGTWPVSVDGGARKKWRARYRAGALIHKSALVDLRLTTTRAGKSVTAVNLLGTPLGLASYPYAMPADAAVLQADLRAAGVTGAVVSTTSGSWSAVIRNYSDPQGSSAYTFKATWSGADITEVRRAGNNALVSLPNYPYTMPADEAQLEADMVAAGWAYIQVTLHKDEWVVFAPDIATTGLERRFEFTVSPTDPIQMWTLFGGMMGIDSQSPLKAVAENIRVSGSTENEAARLGFARLGFIVPD